MEIKEGSKDDPKKIEKLRGKLFLKAYAIPSTPSIWGPF